MKQQLFEWTTQKIVDNPKVFGSDNGNPYIIKEYLATTHKGVPIEDIPLEAFSNSVAVSRMRNKFLEHNPQYDYRQKHKTKNTKLKHSKS